MFYFLVIVISEGLVLQNSFRKTKTCVCFGFQVSGKPFGSFRNLELFLNMFWPNCGTMCSITKVHRPEFVWKSTGCGNSVPDLVQGLARVTPKTVLI